MRVRLPPRGPLNKENNIKLLMCDKCDSIFKLGLKLRTCECGEVKGRYDPDGSHAVVNGKGHSLAIGNGSLFTALAYASDSSISDWRDDVSWKQWWEARPGKNLFLAWARPHAGDSNGHTRVDPNL